MAIAAPLARWRTIRLGLTLGEMAARANLSPGQISQIERGQVMPQPHTAARLADAYELPVDDFLSRFEAAYLDRDRRLRADDVSLAVERIRGAFEGRKPITMTDLRNYTNRNLKADILTAAVSKLEREKYVTPTTIRGKRKELQAWRKSAGPSGGV